MIQRILRFLRRLFPGRRDLAIAVQTELPAVIRVATGEMVDDALRLHVYRDAPGGELLSDVPVRFSVVDGGVELGPDGADRITTRSDAEGLAAVGVRMPGRGQAYISAEVDGAAGSPALFAVRTEGMVDALTLYAEPSYTAESGSVRATAVAVDHEGRPVEDADLYVELVAPIDSVVEGRAVERGGGIYEVVVETRQAGEWSLAVQDRTTRVVDRCCIRILPGKAEHIEIDGAPDPRAERPFDRVAVQAALRDRFGNALDPRRLRATVDGAAVEVVASGDRGTAEIAYTGYGEPELRLTDTETEVERVEPILFTAVWLDGPKIVEPGTSYSTAVYAVPPPDRPTRSATLEITYDPELAAFRSVSPVETGVPLGIEHRAEGDVLILEVTAEREIDASTHPEGILVCSVQWSCEGPGQSCFTCIGKMSPSRPGAGICVEQKHRIANRVCMCTNVIYRPGRRQDRLVGRDMVRQAMRIITRNDWVCCPHVWSVIHECQITGADFARLFRLWGDNTLPQTTDDIDAMFDSGICQRDDCLNVYVIETQQAGVHGRAADIGPPGIVAIDPASFASVTALSAHEMGHSLGLEHRDEAGNVMLPGGSPRWRGELFTSEQCETIWQGLSSYPC